jgi:DHA1 family tetracycline resistance protein-like MFS transporter
MMYAVTALYCLGLGLLNPAVQGLLSRAVPANEQGLLQGAMTSVMTAAAIFGPLLANGSFALFISPEAPLSLPGAPFFLNSLLCLGALFLAWRGTRRFVATHEPTAIHEVYDTEPLAA